MSRRTSGVRASGRGIEDDAGTGEHGGAAGEAARAILCFSSRVNAAVQSDYREV